MASGNYLTVREDWLALRQETVIDPELRIVDAHHHFYDRSGVDADRKLSHFLV